MNEFDKYCDNLLDEAKRFLEIADEKQKRDTSDYIEPFLRSSLLLGFSSLEAFIHGIADDFKDSKALTLHEKAFLNEKEVRFKDGEFVISDSIKITRLTERIEFICQKFKPSSINKNAVWWTRLKDGIHKRNSIVHPKNHEKLTIDSVKAILSAIIDCIDIVFLSVYKKHFPGKKHGLKAKCNFG